MLSKTLFSLAVLVVIIAIFCVRERWRVQSIREWVVRHPESRLIWSFASAEHPELPLSRLFEGLIGCQPLGFASAVQVSRGDGDVWWVEYRSSPSASVSSRWFTLMVRQCGDHAAALRCEEEHKRTAPGGHTWTYESWTCLRHQGLITVEQLELRPVGQ